VYGVAPDRTSACREHMKTPDHQTCHVISAVVPERKSMASAGKRTHSLGMPTFVTASYSPSSRALSFQQLHPSDRSGAEEREFSLVRSLHDRDFSTSLEMTGNESKWQGATGYSSPDYPLNALIKANCPVPGPLPHTSFLSS